MSDLEVNLIVNHVLLNVFFIGNFTLGDEIYYQDLEANICSASYGIKRNIRYLALSFGTDMGTADFSFVYGKKELIYLDKQYLRIINPEKYEKNNVTNGV